MSEKKSGKTGRKDKAGRAVCNRTPDPNCQSEGSFRLPEPHSPGLLDLGLGSHLIP